ncbi:hypothetical protein BgAZ_300240 [Babesia gibsoni]|uniref:RING-type domain-containing protein n=1 Tax=Babesia gibsoni TaxID=33632 RepID=A0AAD8LNV2_BABGI|nr:hypothetical protein BgAZ_300240 [Babesia gibsoni]
MTESKDFECPICFKLLYKPVTTTCGHNFCKLCVEEVTKHNTVCPLCRAPMTQEYGTNLLLTTAISQLFVDEMREREAEERGAIKTDETSYRERCNSNGREFLPIYYHRGRDRPYFCGEEYNILVKTTDMSRMMRLARSNDGRLIRICRRSQYKIGTILQIVNDISQYVVDDSKLPYFVNTIVQERVELIDSEVTTQYGWHSSKFKVIHDQYLFPQSEGKNEGEVLEKLQQAILVKSISGEPLVREYNEATNVAKKKLTDMDRYQLCISLMKICNIIAKRQLNLCSPDGKRLFASRFNALPSFHDLPSSRELENGSMFYSRLILASDKQKWQWYIMQDPVKRLLEVTKLYANAGDACVLQLEDSFSLGIGPFWFSFLILLIVVLVPVFMRRGQIDLNFPAIRDFYNSTLRLSFTNL